MVTAMRLNRFSTAAGVAVILLGALVLLGWVLGNGFLTGIGPGQTTMKANTALSLCALGVAVLLRRFGGRSTTAAAAGLLVLVVGGVTAVEYLSGTEHGIDELVFVDPNRVQAGRMGINTAAAFCLFGAALLLLRRGGRRATLAAHGCAIAALTIAFLAVMGYVNDVRALYGPASYTAMALSTALALSVVAVSLLVSSSSYGIPAMLLARSPGGRMARRLLPLAAVPIVLHAIRAWAVRDGLVSHDVGVWLVATAVVVAIVAAVLVGARAVDRADRPRALLSAVVESSSEAIITTSVERVVTTWNGGAERLYGWPAAEAIGRPIGFLLPADQVTDAHPFGPNPRTGRVVDEETVRLHRDGSRVHVSLTIWAIVDESGSVNGYGSLARDISEQLAIQKQQDSLIDAQKLESLGVLAGGIAHNFNNLLFAMLGNADLALSELPADSQVRERIEQIQIAGSRAAELARDMLAYSGRGLIAVEPVDLPALVRETGRLVSAGSAAEIEIDYVFEDGLPPIVADATQIRQVVLSLVTNSTEALGATGGTIEVRADVVAEIPGDGFKLPSAPLVGPFVRLEVEDCGVGMDDETLASLFDPFFTTKFTGRGLGLAAVLGIVRVHRGAIRVTSELGSGTRTTVLFPCTPS